MHIYGDYRQCTWNVIKRFVPLDYKEDQILSSVKDALHHLWLRP